MNNTDPIRAKHFCNPGDLIASMAGLKSYYQQNGRKVILCQQLNLKAEYYQGAVHGTVSDTDNSTMVCMNKGMFDMMKPLVESQEYIHNMEEFVGQENIYIDIDLMRKKVFVNLPHGSIQSWLMYVYHDLHYDLSKPWIELPDKDLPIIPWIKDKIIVNFTERYRNGHISYFFLRKYKHRLVFAGTDKEHLLFCNHWGIDMPKLDVKDFLEYAYAIKHCKFFLGNQSLGWNIAEAMKTPRVLEVCQQAVNCLPFYGEKSFGFYHQSGVEYYCDILTM